MKFNPISKNIYTDRGEFIKKMVCPFNMQWTALEGTNSGSRKCGNCDREIVDTAFLTDEVLHTMVKQNPDTCFKIDLNQPNLRIVSDAAFGKK